MPTCAAEENEHAAEESGAGRSIKWVTISSLSTCLRAGGGWSELLGVSAGTHVLQERRNVDASVDGKVAEGERDDGKRNRGDEVRAPVLLRGRVGAGDGKAGSHGVYVKSNTSE